MPARSGEQAILRFDGADETGYTVTTVEGDNRVTVKVYSRPVPVYGFFFHGTKEGARGFGFLADYGIYIGGWKISSNGHSIFENNVRAIRAVLGGTTVEYEDALIPTSTPIAAAADFDDFFLFADAFGGSDDRFDLDGNGAVDLADFYHRRNGDAKAYPAEVRCVAPSFHS